jgi:CRP-like cAMP-binding protein
MSLPVEDWVLEEYIENERKEPALFEDAVGEGKVRLEYAKKLEIFHQGEPADSVFYLRRGTVKLSVTSKEGKQAIISILGPGEFFGEECLAGRQLRIATATTVTQCILTRIKKKLMVQMLQEQKEVAELFFAHLLSRNLRYEADLVDHLFNSSEERLARNLLLLSHFGEEGETGTMVPGINQENLAQLVGTTRSRISHFMSKFKKRGFIDYGGRGLTVKRDLRRIVLHDQVL